MASYVPVKLFHQQVTPVGDVNETLSPIIFLHGVTFSGADWGDIPQVIANATRRKAYVVDTRNHGDSEWSEEFNFEILADDLLHLMDTLGIPKAVLIGHSMGGITANKLALRKPNRVEGIVVEDMFIRKIPRSVLQGVVSYIEALRQAILNAPPDLDEKGVKKCILDSVSKAIPAGSTDENIEHISVIIKRNDLGRWAFKGNMEVIQKALDNEDTLMKEPSGEYTGPAIFIYGALSPYLVGKDDYHIKQFFPKAEFVAVDEAHHTVHKERSLQFTDTVLAFISKL